MQTLGLMLDGLKAIVEDSSDLRSQYVADAKFAPPWSLDLINSSSSSKTHLACILEDNSVQWELIGPHVRLVDVPPRSIIERGQQLRART